MAAQLRAMGVEPPGEPWASSYGWSFHFVTRKFSNR